jgi:hypothetical protein
MALERSRHLLVVISSVDAGLSLVLPVIPPSSFQFARDYRKRGTNAIPKCAFYAL